MELDTLTTHFEMLLNNTTSAFEIKAYSNDVIVSFDWDYDFGYFTIKPSKEGGFIVEDEYYVKRFDTIQQVADYLSLKDSDNAR